MSDIREQQYSYVVISLIPLIHYLSYQYHLFDKNDFFNAIDIGI